MAPIECILGFQVYGAALQGHLTNIIQNMFTKESCLFIIRAWGGASSKTVGVQIWDALRTFAEQSVGIEAQGMFLTKDTLMSESIHERGGGGGLCSISSKRIDMENMALDMLYLCDMVIGSGWDLPTHEDMCKETTCNNPKYLECGAPLE